MHTPQRVNYTIKENKPKIEKEKKEKNDNRPFTTYKTSIQLYG